MPAKQLAEPLYFTLLTSIAITISTIFIHLLVLFSNYTVVKIIKLIFSEKLEKRTQICEVIFLYLFAGLLRMDCSSQSSCFSAFV